MKNILIDEALKEWATSKQVEYIDAFNEFGTVKH